MKFLNFKSAMTAVVLVCSLSSFKAVDSSKVAPLSSSCGSIVINDDIMFAETANPDNSIELFIVESDQGQIFTFPGSGTGTSSIDISRLPRGHYYDVSAVTASCSIDKGFYKK